MAVKDSFGSRATLSVDGKEYEYHRLAALKEQGHDVDRLPVSLRILLENLLRHEDGNAVTAEDIEALVGWDPAAEPMKEIAFTPGRVLLQDFTGVPAVVDLAAMRDAMADLGGDAGRINPLEPAEMVIDHSVQVDQFGTRIALKFNTEREFERNRERYQLLRWSTTAFENFKVVPPETGIVHQVNIEYLSRVVFGAGPDAKTGDTGHPLAYPDTLVGTDSHTTMVNGLGVLGWGVGGIEAEAAMLGQPISMLIPRVVGFKLKGTLPDGATATDLVLRITEMLREHGVVGKFVEFHGDGLPSLTLEDRATISNMSPEFGATCALFPVDEETLRYLKFTGRSDEHVALVRAYLKAQGLFHTPDMPEPRYSETLELDLATVEPSIAGPKRPQDRIALKDAKTAFEKTLADFLKASGKDLPDVTDRAVCRLVGEGGEPEGAVTHPHEGPAGALVEMKTPAGEVARFQLGHGAVVIAAITSCTNTSNPSVMVAAGLLAKKAAEKGLKRKPWVKTSLAPGSKVVTEYLGEAGLTPYLEELGFHTVGYGCTTCIGNSGPLPAEISKAIEGQDLVAVSVLSGNRNFEGRINPDVRANYLASPPLVVAYALAGRMDVDLVTEPLGTDRDGNPVHLSDLWPTQDEVRDAMNAALKSDMFRRTYASVYAGSEEWNKLDVPGGSRFAWDPESTYIRQPPFFAGISPEPAPVTDIEDARVLALLGDSVTTDHISPAGTIAKDSPAAKYLVAHGVTERDFNSYGSRRGNHEVMMRGTFANIRLRNKLVPGVEGGFTVHHPTGEQTTIFEASQKYQAAGIPLVVVAGSEYGTGSSRDWAAKGTLLLGVKAVIAESFERIHRSNLIGMGVLPLQFQDGDSAASLGLDGTETFHLTGLTAILKENAKTVHVTAKKADGGAVAFDAKVRLDTPMEVTYFEHGGILQYVLRQLNR